MAITELTRGQLTMLSLPELYISFVLTTNHFNSVCIHFVDPVSIEKKIRLRSFFSCEQTLLVKNIGLSWPGLTKRIESKQKVERARVLVSSMST